MKTTKTFAIIAACLILGIGFMAGSLFGASRNGDIPNDPSNGSERPEELLLRNPDLVWTDDGLTVSGEAAQFLGRDTGMYDAGVADGACTEDQVTEEACLNNMFYVRDLGYRLTLPVADSAELERIDYSDPELSLKTIPFGEVLNNQPLPFLIRVFVSNSKIVTINEVYVP